MDAEGGVSYRVPMRRARSIGLVVLAALCGLSTAVSLAQQEPGRQARASEPPPLPQPDYANVEYGPHERHVLDLWRARRDQPTPLVVYYHGGGFRGGDKRSLSPMLLERLLDQGVSVAAANYRLSDTATYPAQMLDAARALQYLRYHADKYNIDGTRVGATGGSAGAGISMWLAFHDELAEAGSDDPIARQSTRISTAVVYAGQSSYDPRFIQKLFDTTHVHPALVAFFGMESATDLDRPELHRLFEDASVINHATADDPPVLLYYPQANEPLPKSSTGEQHIHHPKLGFVLEEKLDELGVECVLKLREDYPDAADPRHAALDDSVAFLLDKLGVSASR